uniref:C-type lectin domain-containing protein n=1 Tax=Acrobeloides nanus TaxID=290746 RepID=A0A914BX09_9BILA
MISSGIVNILTSLTILSHSSLANLCANGWTYFNSTLYCYKVLSNVNYNDALNACKLEHNATLVSIHSDKENEFVNDLVTRSIEWSSPNLLTALIGLHDPDHSGQWQWTDGSIVDYKSWGPGQPNGQYGKEFCVETIETFQSEFEKRHHWNDIPCDLSRPAAVCAYCTGSCKSNPDETSSPRTTAKTCTLSQQSDESAKKWKIAFFILLLLFLLLLPFVIISARKARQTQWLSIDLSLLDFFTLCGEQCSE